MSFVETGWPLFADALLPQPENWWRAWDLDPVVVAGLFFVAALYASGLGWLRRATSAPRKLRREARCFYVGWTVLLVALVSPVHPLGRVLFFVHMTQHELLMVVAPPLVVLGRPAVVLLWAFPRRIAHAGVRVMRGAGGVGAWRMLSSPFVASLLHALALWVWHVPGLYESTGASEGMHALQHASFFGTALLFWHAVLFGPQRAASNGLAVLYLFLTAMHSGALGALLTFATSLWYPSYGDTSPGWGLSPLEDQQLGGAIMWVPAGLIYMAAGLALFARWLQASDASLGGTRTRSAVRPIA